MRVMVGKKIGPAYVGASKNVNAGGAFSGLVAVAIAFGVFAVFGWIVLAVIGWTTPKGLPPTPRPDAATTPRG